MLYIKSNARQFQSSTFLFHKASVSVDACAYVTYHIKILHHLYFISLLHQRFFLTSTMGSIFCCFFDTTSEEESKNGHFATAEAGSQARVKGVSSDVQALKRADQSHLLNQLTNLPNNKSIRTEIVLGKTVASVGSESKLSSATGTNIKNITTTTKYKFNNHLTNALDQAKDSKEVVKKVGHRLAHDQKLKKTTVHGFEINGSVTQVSQTLFSCFIK